MKFLILFFTIISCHIYSQDLSAFNAIYRKTFLETSQKDFTKALQVADSLYSISQTPVLKAKSLMLTATLYDQSGEFEKSLNFALKSEDILNNTDEVIWKCKIYGFLATHYRYVRLFTKSKKYADLCMLTIQNIHDQEIKHSMTAMTEQEMAYYEIEKKNYRNSIKHLDRALLNLSKVGINTDFSKIVNNQLYGLNHYFLNNLDESLKYYHTALRSSKELPENYLTGLIHNGLASVYLKKKQLIEAKKHLDIAKRIADESKYLSLKNEVYETSERYYAATKKIDELIETKEKREKVRNKLQSNLQSFVNKSYTKIDQENSVIKSSNILKNSILGICIAIIITVIILLFINRRKSKSKIEIFKKLLADIEHKRMLEDHNGDDYSPDEEEYLKKEELITEETFTIPESTVQKILIKLKDFENSKAFLQSTTSLPNLAGYCGTNTKYLSYVIRTRKGKDFSTYINERRIHCIIDQLRLSSKYRNYKISVLAEEAGFSSPNKFSTIFKKVTGTTPSTFIKYLNQTEITISEKKDFH